MHDVLLHKILSELALGELPPRIWLNPKNFGIGRKGSALLRYLLISADGRCSGPVTSHDVSVRGGDRPQKFWDSWKRQRIRALPFVRRNQDARPTSRIRLKQDGGYQSPSSSPK